MSVDTEIEGSPGSIERAAGWLRTTLAARLEDAADTLHAVRGSAQRSWEGAAGDEFAGTMGTASGATDDLEGATREMARDLEAFAAKLQRCQTEMADVRRTASGAGLLVTGFLVQHPDEGPARPPDGFRGTPEEVAAHDERVAAYDAPQALLRAYHAAETEAARVDRAYAAACQDLQQQYELTDHAAWLTSTAEVIGDAAAASWADLLRGQQSQLHAQARTLLDDADRAIRDMQANPDRYLRRRWFFFETLDADKLRADRLAIEGKLDEATDLLRRSDALDDVRGSGRFGAAGRALGALGLGLGVYNDYQDGESATQIAVSQGGSFLAGAGAGAAVGAAVGSVVPVAGTAVGAVVGGIVGAGVSIFADGAIDSVFENGPDVGAALEEGWNALEDTGGAIADGVSGAVSTVGGWFS